MSTTNRLLIVAALLTGPGTARAGLPDEAQYRHMGVAACATSQCHGSSVPRDVSNVLQNEYVTWTQDDPHSGAYATLTSEDSRAIAARLGIGAASSAKICLDCHADNVSAEHRGDKFQLSDGVGCEACHGGSENWLATHYDVPTVGHAANVAAGMYPTDSVPARTELCLSCHLGTADKFATHRIMAAGHPRLSFELDTFTELWRTAGRQPHYRVDADYVDRKQVASPPYTWAAGIVAEATHRMQLVLDPGFDAGRMFPELGLYDCHACHRSMKTVRWQRLERHGDAEPGLPFLNDGSLVMCLALARTLDGDLALEMGDALVALHVSGSEDVDAIRAAARSLAALLGRLDRRLSEDALRGKERRLLRELLATGAEGNYLDYASAEQAFMAVQMLVFRIDDPHLVAALDPLGDALQDDERYSPAVFRRLLAELGGS